jgi:hypothetical protein
MSSEDKKTQHITLEDVVERAKATTLEYGGHVPTLIVQGNKDLVVSEFPDLPDGEDHAEMMYTLGYLLGGIGNIGILEQVIFISEAWLSRGNKENPPQMPASEDPQRIEVLIISALVVQTGQAALALLEMLRNSDDQLIDLKSLTPPQAEDAYMESPLLAAFVQGFQEATRTEQDSLFKTGKSAQQEREPRFSLGRTVATPGAIDAFEQAKQDPREFLARHVAGDWGDLDDEDRSANDHAVKAGDRILSAYHLKTGMKIWIITEWDRSVTTLLLPSEY